MPDHPPKNVLSYARGAKPDTRLRTAALFAAPGMFCWALLFSSPVLVRPSLLRRISLQTLLITVLCLWGIAVITALCSLFYYWRKRTLWYVAVCLISNVLGLGFTALVIAIAALHR